MDYAGRTGCKNPALRLVIHKQLDFGLPFFGVLNFVEEEKGFLALRMN